MGEPGRSRATSADVAREAGVSRATVSYVLNETSRHTIPEATRRRVLDAVARLGYAPSAAARTLRRGRSDLVLFVTPDWPVGHAFGQTVENLTSELAEHRLTLVVHQRCTPQPWSVLLQALSPAAVIGIDAFDPAEEAAMRAAQLPVVSVALDDAPLPQPTGPGSHDPGRRPFALILPQRGIGGRQVEHLAARGHRRLGFGWLADPRVRTFAELRLDGVRQACARLGLPEPVVQTVPMDGAPTAGPVQAWLRAGVTGVCALNDEVAFAVLLGLRTQGLAAPDDLAVVGVDDIPVARFAPPPLTTITHNMPVITRFLATSVRRALSGDPPPRAPRAALIDLVVREST